MKLCSLKSKLLHLKTKNMSQIVCRPTHVLSRLKILQFVWTKNMLHIFII